MAWIYRTDMAYNEKYTAPEGYDIQGWAERELTFSQLGDVALRLAPHDRILGFNGFVDLEALQRVAIRTLLSSHDTITPSELEMRVEEGRAYVGPLADKLRRPTHKGQLTASAYILEFDDRVCGNIPKRLNTRGGVVLLIAGQLALRSVTSEPFSQEVVYTRTPRSMRRNLGPTKSLVDASMSLNPAYTAAKRVGRSYAATSDRSGTTMVPGRGWLKK